MKVGDLVELSAYKNVTGLIVSIKPNVHSAITKRSIFNVLIDGSIHPFRSDMLEVISASR